MSCGKSYFSENVPRVVVQSLFKKYDVDSSGSLQRAELMVLLQEDLGLDVKQAEAVMMVIDKDGNGDVSFDEFFHWLRDKDRLVMDSIDDSTKYHQLRKAVDHFKKFDEDGSGTIERDELKPLLESIEYKGSFDEALEFLDKDGDGKISFPEFLDFISNLKK